MTEPSESRVGSQVPTLQLLPGGVASTLGDEAIGLAADNGLFLEPWQQWVLNMALSQRPDRMWAAFEVALIVPRQNGKNAILEALELAAIFLLNETLVIHSAHRFDTSQEHYLRMQALIKESDDLMRQVQGGERGFKATNGKEAIHFTGGRRLLFKARARGGTRGFTGNRIILDEAYDLPPKVIGNMIPSLATRPNSQVWYTSSAPHADSRILHGLRKRALSPGPADSRLFLASWENDPGADPEDVDNWYRVNPSLGTWISEESVRDEWASMQSAPEEFGRERLGIPDPEPSADGPPPRLDARKWEASAVRPAPEVVPGVPCTLAYDIHQGWCSVAINTGSLHSSFGAVIEHRKGDGWLPGRLAELVQKWRPSTVGLDGANGEAVAALGSVREHFENCHLDPDVVRALTSTQYRAACADVEFAINNGAARRPYVEPDQLDSAGLQASAKQYGDSWVWDRRSARIPLAPLVAWTISRSLLAEPAKKSKTMRTRASLNAGI